MIAIYVIASLSFVICCYWIASHVRRKPKTYSELVELIDTERAGRLFPFVDTKESEFAWDDELLWTEMGGVCGMIRIWKEAGIIITLARQIKKQHENCGPETTEIIERAEYLYLEIIGALIENLWKQSHTSIPRLQTRSCARLCCDIATSLEAVMQICEPTVPVRI